MLILPLMAKTARELSAAYGIAALPDEAVAIITMATLAAVAALALVGWCHGDVKPSNILLCANEVRQHALVTKYLALWC